MTLLALAWVFFFISFLTGVFGHDVAVRWRRFGCHAAAIGSALILALGISGLAGTEWRQVCLSPEVLGPCRIALDRLSGLFLTMLGGIGVSASIFADGYLEHLEKRWNFHWMPLCQAIFLGSLAGVFVADTIPTFLFFWELMVLSSFGLVMLDSLTESRRRTGFIYFAMTHVGSAFLTLALLWPCAHGGSGWGIADWTAGLAGIGGWQRIVVIACLLIGFGTKAGMMPFHVWLPRAYSQAPSHVSALMSGVMVKTGLYGMFRFLAASGVVLGAEWGWLLLGIGSVSMLLGVLYACNEHHLKSLLAYSSIENVGIVLLGLGMGLLLRAWGHEADAAMALAAGLLHAFNHAFFKGLLFMAAGSVQATSHHGNMDELGGMVRTIPGVSMLFFVGAMAISCLPPLNGFAGEWMIYRSLLSGFLLPGLACKIVLPLMAAGLALAGALAAGCFVKAFGSIFLGRPRSAAAKHHAAPGMKRMIGGMLLPAIACIVFGVFPEIIIKPLTEMFEASRGLVASPFALSWPGHEGEGVQPLLLLSCLAFGVLMAWWILGKRGRVPATATVETWNCGTPLTPRMAYTASAFAEPVKVNFSWLLQLRRHLHDHGPLAPLLPERTTYRLETIHLFEEYLYRPLLRAILSLSHGVQKMQAGSLNAYLMLLFVVIVGLLIMGGVR